MHILFSRVGITTVHLLGFCTVAYWVVYYWLNFSNLLLLGVFLLCERHLLRIAQYCKS